MTAPRWIALGFLLLAASVQSVSRADVVYGNLGPLGDGTLSDTNTDFGPSAGSNKILAQGFTTGSDPAFLKLLSVTIGAFAETPSSRTVAIYTNDGGNPGSLVDTSTTATVQAKDYYTFEFFGLDLSPSTSYWVVPQFDSDWSWYSEDNFSQPSGQNGSGYSYLGARRSNGTLAGTWSNTSSGLSVSLQAVPEPSSIILGLAGVAGFVSFRLRQRMARGG